MVQEDLHWLHVVDLSHLDDSKEKQATMSLVYESMLNVVLKAEVPFITMEKND